MRARAWTLVAAAALQGCATPPKPLIVDGPTATVVDATGATTGGYGVASVLLGAGSANGPKGGTFFVVRSIDGHEIPNSLEASRRASFGHGMRMSIVPIERALPAGRPIKIELVGSVAFAAPIQQLVASARDSLHEVLGTVDVTLQSGARYRVAGVLDELHREVWLEEQDSHRIVGTKVVGAPGAERLRANAAPVAYTCCNLHYDVEERWVSDANWLAQPFVPAGTPIQVYEYRSDRAKAMVDDQPLWLGLDYGRKQQTLKEFVGKLAVESDPTPRIAGWPDNVRDAVHDGQAVLGMTKEQLIVSLGYPRADTTRSLDQPRWSYGRSDDETFVVVWDAQGRVAEIEAPEELRHRVLRAP